jgi:hypothetical protein
VLSSSTVGGCGKFKRNWDFYTSFFCVISGLKSLANKCWLAAGRRVIGVAGSLGVRGCTCPTPSQDSHFAWPCVVPQGSQKLPLIIRSPREVERVLWHLRVCKAFSGACLSAPQSNPQGGLLWHPVFQVRSLRLSDLNWGQEQ